jgi:16S rRNA (guanine966-N2)-methyltransferase
MRVIAGEARGVPLVAPSGTATRPTSDKLKAAIFSSLGERGCQGRVLDLFAGSGALGIEALSRGADWCDFVEDSAAACRVIRVNLEKTRLADRAAVHAVSVERFVAGSSGREPYDLLLLDPPYALAGLDVLLEVIAVGPLVAFHSTLLVEHGKRWLPPPQAGAMTLEKTRIHGDSAFSVYYVRRAAAD